VSGQSAVLVGPASAGGSVTVSLGVPTTLSIEVLNGAQQVQSCVAGPQYQISYMADPGITFVTGGTFDGTLTGTSAGTTTLYLGLFQPSGGSGYDIPLSPLTVVVQP